MAKSNNLTDFLKDIADTIRSKDGTTALIDPQTFSSRIINYQNKTVTPSDSVQTITRDNGYMALGTVTVNARPSLSGDAGTGNVLSGKTFYSNSYTKQTGTMGNASITKYVDNSGMSTYFTSSTSSDYNVYIKGGYSVDTAGYAAVSAPSWSTSYYKIKTGSATTPATTISASVSVGTASTSGY